MSLEDEHDSRTLYQTFILGHESLTEDVEASGYDAGLDCAALDLVDARAAEDGESPLGTRG
jgi:hypothetical protein